MKKLFTFLSLLMVSVGIWAQQGEFNGNIPWGQFVDPRPEYFTLSEPYDTPGGNFDPTPVTGLITTNEGTQDLSNYEVAAFVGDECRAWTNPTENDLGQWTVIIAVPSASETGADVGKAITFRIYNKDTRKEYTLNTSSAVTWTGESTKTTFSLKAATGVTLSAIEMNVGETKDLMTCMTVVPEGGCLPLNMPISWTMGNFPSYASISGNTLTALAHTLDTDMGTVLYSMSSPFREEGTLRIYAPATAIAIKGQTEYTLRIGNREDLATLNDILLTQQPDNTHYTVTPANNTDYVRWGIGSTTIIDQSETGGYILKNPGTTTVTPIVVRRAGGEIRPSNPDAITIHVVQPVTDIGFYNWGSLDIHNKANVNENVYARLSALVDVRPGTANNKAFTFRVYKNGEPAQSNTDYSLGENSLKFKKAGTYKVQVVSVDDPDLVTNYSYMDIDVENPATTIVIGQETLNLSYDSDEQGIALDVTSRVQANIGILPTACSHVNGTITSTGDAFTINDTNTSITCDGRTVDVQVGLSNVQTGSSVVTVSLSWNDYSGYNGSVESIRTSSATETFTVNVTITEGLDKFLVTHTPGANGTGTLVFTPVPAAAAFNPDDIIIYFATTDASASYPQSWKTATISNRTVDSNNVITVNYTGALPGFVGVGAQQTVVTPNGGFITFLTLVDASNAEAETTFTGFTVPATYTFDSGWQWRSNSYGEVAKDWEFFNNTAFLPNFAEARTQSYVLINDASWGLFSNGNFAIEQGQCYKIKMKSAGTSSLTNGYFDGDNHSYSLYKGWTWVGSPYVYDRLLTNALPLTGATLANETRIVSKTGGTAVWDAANSKWTGTLTTIEKNQGYLVYSPTAGQALDFAPEDEMAQGDEGSTAGARSTRRNVWSYDASQFANNMSMIAQMKNVDNLDDYTVGAFVDGECRGEGVAVDGRLFITVHGNSGELVTFRLHNELTGEYYDVPETVTCQQMLGTLSAPVNLTAPAVITGINTAVNNQQSTTESYDLLGRKVTNGKLLIKRMADGSVRKVVK